MPAREELERLRLRRVRDKVWTNFNFDAKEIALHS